MILSLNSKKTQKLSRTITIILILLHFFVGATSTEKMTSQEEGETFVREAEACRIFSSDLYKIIGQEMKDQNIISSPLSVHILLSYLTHGAKGNTAEEMINRLSIRDIEHLHLGYKSLTFSMNATEKAELWVANSLFISDELELITTFSTIGSDYYNFSLAKSDFRNGQKSADEINGWVKEKTNDKITEIIQSDDITDDTQMILVNAIYFKGTWLFPFNPDNTKTHPFYLTEKHDKQVPMMSLKKRYRHGDLDELNAKFIEIPYSDENLSMVVILPNEINGLPHLEKNFNWNIVVTAEHRTRETLLVLPKFKIECKINLKDVLQKHGLTTIFQDIANFTGISDKPLKVSKILQKAFVEVNEMGTEAAAVTVLQIRTRRAVEEPDEFIVDHPFMIVIRHKPSDVPIFIGSVRDIIVHETSKDEL